MRLRLSRRQRVGTHFFEGPVLIDGSIDALDVQIFCLRSRVIKSQPFEGTDFHLSPSNMDSGTGAGRESGCAFGHLRLWMHVLRDAYRRESLRARFGDREHQRGGARRAAETARGKTDLACELEKIVHRCLQRIRTGDFRPLRTSRLCCRSRRRRRVRIACCGADDLSSLEGDIATSGVGRNGSAGRAGDHCRRSDLVSEEPALSTGVAADGVAFVLCAGISRSTKSFA